MKNIKFLFAAILVSLFLTRCDYVTPKKSTVVIDTAIVYQRNILIEDYTGQKCGNCPYAAYNLDSTIIMTYGSKIIPIAVHAGYFAIPDLSGFYTKDYRTSAGTTWDGWFNMSSNGNPAGMVNRQDFLAVTNHKQFTDWYGIATNILANLPSMNIKITNSYDSTSRNVTSKITSKFLQQLDSTYMLSVVLTEDTIIGNQDEYIPYNTGNAVNLPNYVFNHMLRASFNGAWGDTLSTGPHAINDSIPKTYNLTLNSNFVAKHCNVIAFIYNSVTYEVVQAEIARVTTQ